MTCIRLTRLHLLTRSSELYKPDAPIQTHVQYMKIPLAVKLLQALLYLCLQQASAQVDNDRFSLPTSYQENSFSDDYQDVAYNDSRNFGDDSEDDLSMKQSPKVRYEPPKEIVIGYITSLKKIPGALYIPPGQLISGAITYAVKQINDNPDLLPNTTLRFVVEDTHGNERRSLYHTAEMIFNKIHAIIGPQETCVHEAFLAGVYNIPMISYVSTALHQYPVNM